MAGQAGQEESSGALKAEPSHLPEGGGVRGEGEIWPLKHKDTLQHPGWGPGHRPAAKEKALLRSVAIRKRHRVQGGVLQDPRPGSKKRGLP